MAAKKLVELKELKGRGIASFKQSVFQEGMSLDQWAAAANAKAEAEGISNRFTPEKMESVSAPKKEKEPGLFDHQQPQKATLEDLRRVAAIVKERSTTIATFQAEVAEIKEVASKVGGLDRLAECLTALEEFAGIQD